MKLFKEQITLNKNNRGCYILDTIKGCSIASNKNPKGCYNNCYAQNIAYRYKFNFGKPVKRDFNYDKNQLYLFELNDSNINNMIEKIKNIDMPFVRIGEMGDPSEDWEHTIYICKIISQAKKPIVIITKHIKSIPDKLLTFVKRMDIHINTSISALDTDSLIKNRLTQFNRLKNHCNSVLRIVSCNFNKNKKEGISKLKIQDELFKNENTIDTIFRPNIKNKLVVDGIINIEKVRFLKSKVYASIFNKKTYLGGCELCIEKCGIYKNQ